MAVKSLTMQERKQILWLRDFVDDAMSAADDPAFLRRAIAATKTLQRWIDVDNERREGK